MDAGALFPASDALRASRALLAAAAARPPGPPRRAFLEALLEHFAATCRGHRQRTPGWYAAMGTTVGGSELAAVLGMSPYGNFASVASAKVALLRGTAPPWRGGPACWWGTLFEDVTCAVVEADLGARVIGDSICVQAFEGHRNSPDGYAVVRVFRDDGGALRLWQTHLPEPAGARETAVLLEFKSPLTRLPAGGVPRHYRPQLWSGLAVSPAAEFGLFVDAVFRKCSLADLDGGGAYDTAFHRGRRPGEAPVAWGLIAVYAPAPGAPLGVRRGWKGAEWAPGDPAPGGEDDEDASEAAAAVRGAGGAPPGELVDLGGLAEWAFVRALGLVERKRFPVLRLPPCFADGRGADLRSPAGLRAAFAAAGGGAPPGHELLGVLPWKLFELSYTGVARHPDFVGEILPRVAELHALVAEALAAPDPGAVLAGHARRADPAGAAAADAAAADAAAESEALCAWLVAEDAVP